MALFELWLLLVGGVSQKSEGDPDFFAVCVNVGCFERPEWTGETAEDTGSDVEAAGNPNSGRFRIPNKIYAGAYFLIPWYLPLKEEPFLMVF